MEGEKREMVLLEIKERLGKIDGTTTAIKEDIAELKQKDISQSQALEEAYAKAKSRQDSIRDDLQHQIDGNKTLILAVSDNINTLNKNIDKLLKDFADGINTKINHLDTRIKTLETKKEKALLKWWDKIFDKLILVAAVGAVAGVLKWLGFSSEFVDKFSK